MELTLDQALQKGIEAHKAGKAQEADRYYTAILKTNPKHPARTAIRTNINKTIVKLSRSEYIIKSPKISCQELLIDDLCSTAAQHN